MSRFIALSAVYSGKLVTYIYSLAGKFSVELVSLYYLSTCLLSVLFRAVKSRFL